MAAGALALVSSCVTPAAVQVDLGKGRVLPLSRLRGSVRPLVVAGSKGYVNKVLRDAKRFKADLRERGVSRACPAAAVLCLLTSSQRGTVPLSQTLCACGAADAAVCCVRWV